MTRAKFSAVKKEKNASIILRRPKIARVTHARVVRENQARKTHAVAQFRRKPFQCSVSAN